MVLTAKIRAYIGKTRSLNVLLALCFLAAQLVPTGLAAAASLDQSGYVVICTADGFKKVPLADLGLGDLPGAPSDLDIPGQQDCPLCVLICAHGGLESAPQVAVIWAPLPVDTPLILDDRPVTPIDLASLHDATPRAPPAKA